MIFHLIGTITGIYNLPYGMVIKIRETQIGTRSRNGHNFGTYDYTWDCVINNSLKEKYIRENFKEGVMVSVLGNVGQAITKDDGSKGFKDKIFRIKTVDIFNLGDPTKEKKRERYNSKVVGDEAPDIGNKFESDF